jgi:hypothetical protein
LLLIGCSHSVRTRCERVCRAEQECADKLDVSDNDYAECVETCTALERDPHTQKIVEAHIRCVTGAETCDLAMECE